MTDAGKPRISAHPFRDVFLPSIEEADADDNVTERLMLHPFPTALEAVCVAVAWYAAETT